MAESRQRRSRGTYRQRYFHNEREGDSQPNERYTHNGPLSPLRSPVNREKGVTKRNSRMNKRSPFKVKVAEFPPLGSHFTPEIGFIKHNSSKLDWATQAETFEKLSEMENENLKKYRRKLELGIEKKEKSVVEMEEDSTILMRRQKAVDYGKNTSGYDKYLQGVKRTERRHNHPKTPNKYIKTSRRSWDMQVRLWRRALHQFDPPSDDVTNSADVSMTDVSSECSASMEKTVDSDTSDNGSELLDYRNTQTNEHFSHHLSQEDDSSIKDSMSLDSGLWISAPLI